MSFYPITEYSLTTDINQLPEKLDEKSMCLPYPANTLNGRTVQINGKTYKLDDSITLEMLHIRYKREKKIDNRFIGVKQTWIVESTGKKKLVYQVKQDGDKFICSCPGYSFRKNCKHILKIKEELKIK